VPVAHAQNEVAEPDALGRGERGQLRSSPRGSAGRVGDEEVVDRPQRVVAEVAGCATVTTSVQELRAAGDRRRSGSDGGPSLGLYGLIPAAP
jgi:hypothetical protein